jgi:AraC-like DNA-binding protein
VSAKLGISLAALRPIAAQLDELGEDGHAFLRAIGVDAQTPQTMYVSADAVDRELAAIDKRRGEPGLGVALAELMVRRPRGPFSIMVWHSGTLGEALERMIKHYASVSPRRVFQLEVDGSMSHLRSTALATSLVRGHVLTELVFATFVARARAATGGRFRARAMRFNHSGVTTDRYRTTFGVDIEFGAPRDELDFDSASLSLPLDSADPLTSHMIESTIATLAPLPESFLHDVRCAAASNLDASLHDIARKLGLSERTLRRRLERHGATLRAITHQLRRERADALLASGLNVKEVAFKLGFSEASAFSRAYKRWSGHAPNARNK